MTRPSARKRETQRAAHEAPIFVDGFELARWLLDRTRDTPQPLAVLIAEAASELVELLALALSGREKLERLHAIDDLLIRLRMRIRLANSVGLLDERQALFAAERLDAIGHQLGGWIRKSQKGTWQSSPNTGRKHG